MYGVFVLRAFVIARCFSLLLLYEAQNCNMYCKTHSFVSQFLHPHFHLMLISIAKISPGQIFSSSGDTLPHTWVFLVGCS